MRDLLQSPKGKRGAFAAGGLLFLIAVWFVLVAPQRSKASELAASVSAAQSELALRTTALQHPKANITVKPSDRYRLAKAMPAETDMAGILVDVDRLARSRGLEFDSIRPSQQVTGTGYVQQPLAIVVQGRFGDLSKFLGDLGSLVSVRGGRLDTRGRLYSVSQIDISAPETGKTFPVVKAALTLNAYSYSASAPALDPTQSTTTDASSGTVAAGVTP